jgi:hypothetical protein
MMWMMRKEASTWKENWLQPYTIVPAQAKILVRTGNATGSIWILKERYRRDEAGHSCQKPRAQLSYGNT